VGGGAQSGPDGPGCLDRAVDLRGADVQVGHGADRAWTHRAGADAVGQQPVDDGRRVERAGQVEQDDVSLDGRGV
jgi:hypothetical protein